MDQLLICDLRLCVLLPLSIVASTTVTIPWFWPQATGLIEQGEEQEGELVKWVKWGFLKTKLLNNVGWGEWRVFLHSEFFCLIKQNKQATGLIEQGEEKEGGSDGGSRRVKWRNGRQIEANHEDEGEVIHIFLFVNPTFWKHSKICVFLHGIKKIGDKGESIFNAASTSRNSRCGQDQQIPGMR